MKVKQVNEALGKIHLEEGDALIVDARVFSVKDFTMSRAPKDCRIFPVVPEKNQTIHQTFLVMLDAELRKLTREKLKELLDATA